MHRCAWLGFLTTVSLLASRAASAGEKKADAPLIILDATGKEVKLKGWHLTAGVRRLPVDGDKGPEYLEFREEHSTTYENGILTLAPISSVRKLDYNHDKKTVTAVVATAGDKDVTLSGTTKYLNFNRLTIEGDADLGELGFASVKFQGGNPKGGVTGVRFPNTQPVPEAKPPTAVVIGEDKGKPRHEVSELTALYRQADGSVRLSSQLFFKKTAKIDLAKLAALRHIEPEDKKQTSYDFEVTLASGDKHTLTMLTKVDMDGKGATLVGFLSRVAVGYKLFPVHTIAELRMEPEKK
jgi:hypothetical protein